jgi:hypothetical protein
MAAQVGLFASSELSQRSRSVNEKECRRSKLIRAPAPLESFKLAAAPDAGQLDADGVLCAAEIAAFEAKSAKISKELADATARKDSTGRIGMFNNFLVLNNFGAWFEEIEPGVWRPRKRASGGAPPR